MPNIERVPASCKERIADQSRMRPPRGRSRRREDEKPRGTRTELAKFGKGLNAKRRQGAGVRQGDHGQGDHQRTGGGRLELVAVGEDREFGAGFLDDGGIQVCEQEAGGAVELFQDFSEGGDDDGVPDAGGGRALGLDALAGRVALAAGKDEGGGIRGACPGQELPLLGLAGLRRDLACAKSLRTPAEAYVVLT